MPEISCWRVTDLFPSVHDVVDTTMAGMMETLSYTGKPGDRIVMLEEHLCQSIVIFTEKTSIDAKLNTNQWSKSARQNPNKDSLIKTNEWLWSLKYCTVKLYTMLSASIRLCAATLESFLSQRVHERAWNLLTTPPSLTEPDLFFQSLHDSLPSFIFFHLYASPQSIRVPHLTPQWCCEAAHCCLGEIAFTHADFPGMWMKLLQATICHRLSLITQAVIRQSCHTYAHLTHANLSN